MNKRLGLLAAGGLAVALVAGGGTALASIPGSQGVITGCYDSGGNLKVIDTSATPTCPKGYSTLTWNASGKQGPPGPQGPQGPAGATGQAGQQGATGAAGPQGPQGTAGTDGKTILSGNGAPAGSAGNDGDFYIDTVADVLYGPKSGGAWPATGTSLTGPQGTPGATGSAGPAGPAGASGSPGSGATVAPLSAGDPNCASGGASITDGFGNTAYACDGAAGSQGPAGPAGPQGPAGPTGPQGPGSGDVITGSSDGGVIDADANYTGAGRSQAEAPVEEITDTTSTFGNLWVYFSGLPDVPTAIVLEVNGQMYNNGTCNEFTRLVITQDTFDCQIPGGLTLAPGDTVDVLFPEVINAAVSWVLGP